MTILAEESVNTGILEIFNQPLIHKHGKYTLTYLFGDNETLSINKDKKVKTVRDHLQGTLSDRLLKENIELVGKSNLGINIYEFDYIDKSYGDGRYRGVMAQEVPWASIKDDSGYYMVDYSKVDVPFEKIN